ncbi:hypothetical protein AURDEDRAFT_171629 [Auricularia subglabra TFB-10046 SS5]|nr:hypothetical protein AURDEDRAFT_171629 [Auricularia subglabra TFB-10046 SS5]
MEGVPPALSVAYDSATAFRTGLGHVPIELHGAWLRYLSQPELLRIGLLSKSWRALSLEVPHFYLSVRLGSIRAHHKRFIQQLDYAAGRGLPIGIHIFFPCAVTELSHGLMESRISPAIERSMPYVRKLSIISGAAISAAGLAFLQTPAPILREFMLRIGEELDGEEGERDSANDSDYDSQSSDDWSPGFDVPMPPIVPGIFDRSAPKLKRVDLYGITLPDEPAEAFSGAVYAKLGDLSPIPASGLGVHFPAAKHMELKVVENGAVIDMDKTCTPATWLPSELSSFYLDDYTAVPSRLIQLADLLAVPHLTVTFDGYYTFNFLSRGLVVRMLGGVHEVEEREAAWATLLSPLASPRRLDISSTNGGASDLYVAARAVMDPARSVTFYTNEPFIAVYPGDHYGPLSGLKSLLPDLVELSVEHAHLLAVFHIADAFPALRLLSVSLVGKQNALFWNAAVAAPRTLQCPALEQLELSGDQPGGEVPSEELALFARSLGLSATRRARLALSGVQIQKGTLHRDLFDL